MVSKENRDQALFDEIAEKYMRKDLAPVSSIPRKAQLFAALGTLLKKTRNLGVVVDVGCGVGAPAKYLDGYYDQYIGIDQSPEMIRVAEIFNQGNSRTHFFADNIKKTDIPQNTADIILSIGALHHMTELDKVMENLVTIAKGSANFVVVEPQNANPFIQLMRWVRTKLDRSYSDEQVFFSEIELLSLFSAYGIENLEVSYQGYFSTPFAQVLISPQRLSLPLSRLSVQIDRWIQKYLKGWMRKLSFNIIITGRFKKTR